MSEEERKNLTKEMYLEMQKFFKDEFAEVKDWMKENFVCARHCQYRQSKVDKQFMFMIGGLIVVGAIAGVDNLIPLALRMIGLV